LASCIPPCIKHVSLNKGLTMASKPVCQQSPQSWTTLNDGPSGASLIPFFSMWKTWNFQSTGGDPHLTSFS
jgi:hypothetical protein